MENLTVSLSESPENKEITLFTVKGSMDTNTISEFEKNFQAAMGDNRYKLVIDLKDVQYISSAGWGLFVSEIKRIRRENGDLVLAGMSPEVMEVFELLEFDTILKFYPEVDSAVKKGFKGLPPWAGKTNAPLKTRVLKTDVKKALLESTAAPVPLVAPPTEPSPAAAPEPETRVVHGSPGKGLLRGWRFWAVLLLALAALGAYGMTGHLSWWPQEAVFLHGGGVK